MWGLLLRGRDRRASECGGCCCAGGIAGPVNVVADAAWVGSQGRECGGCCCCAGGIAGPVNVAAAAAAWVGSQGQ
jgi:hypothetical protein